MTTVFDLYNQTYASIDKASVINVESQLAHSLEGLVDATSLEAVIDALIRVCNEKAEHLEADWQDGTSAMAWNKAAAKLAKVPTRTL